MTWLSAPATAMVDDSDGLHSTDVTAFVCQWKLATGFPEAKLRRSQTRKEPSSAAGGGRRAVSGAGWVRAVGEPHDASWLGLGLGSGSGSGLVSSAERW